MLPVRCGLRLVCFISVGDVSPHGRRHVNRTGAVTRPTVFRFLSGGTFGGRCQSITTNCNLLVKPLPERKAKWNVQQGQQPPQPWQYAAEISKRLGPTIDLTTRRNDMHYIQHRLGG